MADNTIALQGRALPQTNVLNTITDVMNLGRSAVGLQRETETLPYSIESAKGMASQATTGASSATFELNQKQAKSALDIIGGLANDPVVLNAGQNPQAALQKLLDAKKMILAQGVPENVVEANTAPMIAKLMSNPQDFVRTIQNIIQGGLGPTGQQALQTPQLTEAGGAPATFQSGTNTLRTTPIMPAGSAPSTTSAPAAPFTGQPTEPSQQVMPQTPQAGGDLYAEGMPTGKPGTFFGKDGKIVDSSGKVLFDPLIRDASGQVIDGKAIPPEYDPLNKPIDKTLGTAQPFPVAPPPAIQGAPLPPQAGVSADQMAQPVSTGAGFKLSYPVRKAGEAVQRLPAEVADEAAGNMYRNSLIKNQGNLVTNRRNLEEVISEAIALTDSWADWLHTITASTRSLALALPPVTNGDPKRCSSKA